MLLFVLKVYFKLRTFIYNLLFYLYLSYTLMWKKFLIKIIKSVDSSECFDYLENSITVENECSI